MTAAVDATVIETVVRKPLLGLRFHDDATGEVVRDVRVRLTVPGLAEPARPVVTPSGVFAWRSLPGLSAWALGGADVAVDPVPADVVVDDPGGRYLAYRFGVSLPAGLADVTCGSPPEPVGSPVESPPEGRRAAPSLPLFSAPGRPAPTATAVVRAALRRRVDGVPAAYATLRVVAESGQSARGVADRRGQLVVFLPYPEPTRSRDSVPSGSTPFGSGPLGSRPPLASMRWELTVLAGLPRRPLGADEVPHLCDLLDQDGTRLWSVGDGGPDRPLTTAPLRYGLELVLPDDGPRRELLVGP